MEADEIAADELTNITILCLGNNSVLPIRINFRHQLANSDDEFISDVVESLCVSLQNNEVIKERFPNYIGIDVDAMQYPKWEIYLYPIDSDGEPINI
jgi:hypothetical protein